MSFFRNVCKWGGFCLVLFGLALYCSLPALAADTKYYAPKLNVPIPGLRFSDYPIIRHFDTISISFLGAYVASIYRYIAGISVITAAIMIVYGGFKYIVGSTGGSTTDAKKIITDAVLGLFLMFGSYTILAVLSPSLVAFKPLNLKVIPREEYLSHAADLDGVPLNKMTSWDRSPAPSGSTGNDANGIGKGCGVSGAYTIPASKCSGAAACQQLFCGQKDYSITGVPSPDELVGFSDFPPSVGEQINAKGITFTTPSFCGKSGGCDATKYLSTVLLGPKASAGQANRMKGGMIFRPEVRDALIKAGAAAKSKGYFLAISDGYRSMQTQAQNWCQRIAEKGSSLGMATPGLSPHQMAIAVDIGLFKLENGNYTQLTLIGDLCHQVSLTQSLGPQYLRMLEDIMASAGFKHMCGEVWHFNYAGIYPTDCSSCDFPGEMQKRIDKDKTCKSK